MWQKVEMDDEGFPAVNDNDQVTVLRRCRCTEFLGEDGSDVCEGCNHHTCFHKLVLLGSKEVVVDDVAAAVAAPGAAVTLGSGSSALVSMCS